MNDVESITLYFKSGRHTSYCTVKEDPLFSVLINDMSITLKWKSGSSAKFNREDLAGYYVYKKG